MKTILVVDDEIAIADMLRTLLEEEGYRVVTAVSGRDALAALTATRVSLVVTDFMMPMLDGQELARQIKAAPAYTAIPIILMSAVGKRGIQNEKLFAGFLVKPFNIDAILALVERLIGKPDS